MVTILLCQVILKLRVRGIKLASAEINDICLLSNGRCLFFSVGTGRVEYI